MSQNGLLLQRYTGKPPGRAHDGKIITIRPNLRWTSDGFEIACWNGQVVRVAFALGYLRSGGHGLVCQHRRHQRGDDPRSDARERRAALWRRQPCRIRSSGSRTMAAAIGRMRRSTLRPAWASCHASRRCAARSRTAWPNRSSKPSSEITSMFTIALMLKQSCPSCRHGSRTTTRAIHIKPCE